MLDARHALFLGWIVGQAHAQGLEPVPVVDDVGDYTNRFTVVVAGLVTVTVVVPPPPSGWTLPEDV